MKSFARYVDARIDQETDELMYRVYISDGLKYIAGTYTERYIDIIDKIKQNEPPESGEQIVEKVMQKGGLHFKAG